MLRYGCLHLVKTIERSGDRSNLVELIDQNGLGKEFADRLDPSVRSRYLEILND